MKKNEAANNTIELITYQEMINSISAGNCHLLLGNGFNLSLGINTSYESIFERMMENFSDYKQLEDEFAESYYDIELIIGKLQDSIEINNSYKIFLNNFLQNKLKTDFMKSAISIVVENIKDVYQEHNEGIHILFEKFANYFTLNYDPFLYLLLMKFKKKNDTTIAFQNKSKFIVSELADEETELYQTVKKAYSDGKIILNLPDREIVVELNKTTKADFNNQIKRILKDKYPAIKGKAITKITKIFLESLGQDNRILDINDGFQEELFKDYKRSDAGDQNLFFIHGAFHLYQKGKLIKKITKTSEQSLYQRLEEIIEDENQDVICIFQAQDKEKIINDNKYLVGALNKLSEIEGELVLFGCALSENDNHIFKRIQDNTKIPKLYISATETNFDNSAEKARTFFPDKEIVLFDYKTVSYAT